MIALSEAHRAGLLRRKNWLPNIASGVIVGVLALPLAMAFAIADADAAKAKSRVALLRNRAAYARQAGPAQLAEAIDRQPGN